MPQKFHLPIRFARPRLCTLAEVESDCTMTTGCNFDDELIWTSDSEEDIAHNFKCCKSGEITISGMVAECPSGVNSNSTTNGEICFSDEQSASSMHDAIETCWGLGGGSHVCTFADVMQGCTSGVSAFASESAGWFGGENGQESK
jgi:hypothetical protein